MLAVVNASILMLPTSREGGFLDTKNIHLLPNLVNPLARTIGTCLPKGNSVVPDAVQTASKDALIACVADGIMLMLHSG